MRKLTVKTESKSYPVHIGRGLLEKAGELAAGLFGVGTAAVVTDSTVDGLYAEQLMSALQRSGFKTVNFTFPAGEASKNAKTLFELLNFLASRYLTRTDAVFALGGGVVGDLAGLGAALYLRGIHLVQIPTTVLAAVDSSVGGKTAIDLAEGKNLAGVFYQPDLVLCDTTTLTTLSQEEFANGFAEVIKYAIIKDETLFKVLIPPVEERLEEIIARCVSIKRDVVSADEKETGERQILNFGHTFGHAVEKCSGYTTPHGSAVAAGMAIMTRACVKQGICGPECLTMLLEALTAYGLPTETDYEEQELFAAMLADKKRTAGEITLVVPRRVGCCERRTVPMIQAKEFLRLGLEKNEV